MWTIEDPQELGADAGRCSLLQATATAKMIGRLADEDAKKMSFGGCVDKLKLS